MMGLDRAEVGVDTGLIKGEYRNDQKKDNGGLTRE